MPLLRDVLGETYAAVRPSRAASAIPENLAMVLSVSVSVCEGDM